MDLYASIISAKIQKSFPGLRSRDNLKAFKSAKHHRKLHSKWTQVNCVRGLIKEGNETKNQTMCKPGTIQTATINAGKILT